MILITGDTHGINGITRFKSHNYSHLTKDDYVIICGDCGVLFSPSQKQESIDKFNSLPFTVLFVDGNHENFDLLDAYPVEFWNGGKIHKIADTVIHLMRGQVFEIEGHTFFTFGGGLSLDKAIRVPHISWWEQEQPTEDEIEEGLKNLALHHNKVDFIISHDCPASMLPTVCAYSTKFRSYNLKYAKSNEALERIYAVANFKQWFFGHFHIDQFFTSKFTCVYENIILLEGEAYE